MLHSSFQVFGVRIYLQDKNKLLCTKVDNIEEQFQSLQDSEEQKTVISVKTDDKTVKDDNSKTVIRKTDGGGRNGSQSKAVSSIAFLNTFLTALTVIAFYNEKWR